MQEQMTLLMKVVWEKSEGHSAKGSETVSIEREVKFTKLTETDDIETYLTTFERMMQALKVPKDQWVYKLAPQLTGKAQQVFAAMETKDAGDYEPVKAVAQLSV